MIFYIDTQSDFSCQNFHLCCLLYRQSALLSNWDAGEDDRPFRIWPSPLFPEAAVIENTLPLSSQSRLSFLFDSW